MRMVVTCYVNLLDVAMNIWFMPWIHDLLTIHLHIRLGKSQCSKADWQGYFVPDSPIDISLSF